MSNHDRLRQLAQEATPGPWVAETFRKHPADVLTLDSHDPQVICEHAGVDAEFIAAANPTMVLALLDELDAARRGQGRAHDAPPVAGRLHETHPIPDSRSEP